MNHPISQNPSPSPHSITPGVENPSTAGWTPPLPSTPGWWGFCDSPLRDAGWNRVLHPGVVGFWDSLPSYAIKHKNVFFKYLKLGWRTPASRDREPHHFGKEYHTPSRTRMENPNSPSTLEWKTSWEPHHPGLLHPGSPGVVKRVALSTPEVGWWVPLVFGSCIVLFSKLAVISLKFCKFY